MGGEVWPGGKTLTFSGKDGSANWQTDWLLVPNGCLWIFHVVWTSVAATAGTFGVQVAHDPNNTDSIITLPGSLTGYGAWPSSTAAAVGTAAIVISNPFPYMRGNYTRSAGGGANQFSGWTSVRAFAG